MENILKDMLCVKVLTRTYKVETLKAFYDCTFIAYMRYAIIYWDMYSDADKVFLIQKRGIRTVVNLSYRDSCRTLFKTYSVFSSYEMFILETFCFFL